MKFHMELGGFVFDYEKKPMDKDRLEKTVTVILSLAAMYFVSKFFITLCTVV